MTVSIIDTHANIAIADEAIATEAAVSDAIAIPQEVADNDDLLEHVPASATRSPTAMDLEEWLRGFAAIGAAAKATGDRGHVANAAQFATAVLAFWFAKDQKFTVGLAAKGFRFPTGKKEFAGAASYIYDLNTGNDDGKRTTSKRVTSLSSQYEGLRRELIKRGLRPEDFDFGRDSARRLVAIITDAGGTNALEHAPKEDRDEDPKPIPLSAERKGNVLYLRGIEALGSEGATFRMPLEVVLPNGNVERRGEAAQALIEAAIADTAPTLARTQALAELLEMGGCVLVEPSSQPKKHDSDPNDPNMEKRLDERQVVFHKDDKVTQSSLLRQSGVVVETRTHVGNIILGDTVQGHTRLYTEKRKRIEENLKDDRRRWFDVGVIEAGPDAPTGVGRLVIFTDAASGDSERQSANALLQGLTGQMPLDVDPKTLKPVAQCEVAADILNANAGSHEGSYAANAEKLFKRKARAGKGKEAVRPEITVTIDGRGLTLKSPADANPVTLRTTGTKDDGNTTVRLDDFVAFLRTFAKVHSEVTSDVSCWMGEAVLCFEFATRSAKHRVFIPKSAGGHRSERSIVKIKNQPWPEGQSLKPNNFG